jgi:hypothetical protein
LVWIFGLELDGEIVEPDPHADGSPYKGHYRAYQTMEFTFEHVKVYPTIATVLRVFSTPLEDLPALMTDPEACTLAIALLKKGRVAA